VLALIDQREESRERGGGRDGGLAAAPRHSTLRGTESGGGATAARRRRRWSARRNAQSNRKAENALLITLRLPKSKLGKSHTHRRSPIALDAANQKNVL